MIGNKCRSLHEISKKFLRVENVINRRPILKCEDKVYTAFELSTGRNLFPNEAAMEENLSILQEYRSKFLEEICKLWISQYLKRMTILYTETATKLEVGHWVMVPSLLTKRAEWPLARIMDIRAGTDGVVAGLIDV
ncbi:hypothetical protein BLOT_008113 [Blomia tropicalis]|nr:hypothetical protein BLOT_008113 [Blomia tropicalis]